MARPSKFTPTVSKKILEGLKAGLTRNAAAGRAGIHVSQITRWCARYANFANDCAIAEAEAEARFTSILCDAADGGDPKMALEWLKRRRREEWGDALRFDKMTPDELITFIAGDAPGVAEGAPDSPGDREAVRQGR